MTVVGRFACRLRRLRVWARFWRRNKRSQAVGVRIPPVVWGGCTRLHSGCKETNNLVLWEGGGRRTRTQDRELSRSRMTPVVQSAGRWVVRRTPVQATVLGIVALQVGVKSKVRRIMREEADVRKQGGRRMG